MSNKTEAALHGRTLQDELRAAAPESDDYSLLMRAATALDQAEPVPAAAGGEPIGPVVPQFKLLGAEEALAFLGMGQPQVVEVHHHDIEKHAESFNEGYNAAMAHQLMSDDELQSGGDPDEWLAKRLLEAQCQAWDDGHHAGVINATTDEPGFHDNPYRGEA